MKPLSLLGMAMLALVGCKEAKKDQASGEPAFAKRSKMGERPATRPASAEENLPYPEGLKLIEAAEKTSGVMTSLIRAHRELFVPDLGRIIAQQNSQPPPPPTPGDERVKAEVVEARKAHMAATTALTRYEGSAFEEEQIKAFQERQRLRQQVTALEGRLNSATAPDNSPTANSLPNELEARKKTLEDMDTAWKKMSTSGWRDHVEPETAE